MEVLSGILSIAAVVWGILSIILFFKVWGMCNNVSSILQILAEKDEEEEKESKEIKPAKQKKATPPKKEIKAVDDSQDFMMAFNDDCLVLFKQCQSKEEFESKVDEIIQKYNKTRGVDYSALKDGLWEQFKQL